MDKHQVALRANWIVPVSSPPIRDGVVTIQDGHISSIGKASNRRDTEEIQLGDVVLIPGLINAHTHLEFSDLESPLGNPRMAFPDWILEVVSHRMTTNEESKSEAISKGLAESFAAGVVHVGEIATCPIQPDCYQRPGEQKIPTSTLFCEVLGRNPDDVPAKIEQLEAFLELANKKNMKAAISPHAPYSVGPTLWQALMEVASKYQLPLALHLAESREELELLDKVSGPFVDLLKKLKAWFPDTYRNGTTPMDYLRAIQERPGSLIIHGNYLNDAELDFVAKTKTHVVYCPRTHAYFGHEDYPLKEMLDRGINVAVGTDSRASNPNLNLFEELQQIRRQHPTLNSEEILKMGTLNGAMALRVDSSYGSLEVGKAGRLAKVEIGHEIHEEDLFDAVIEAGSCKSVLV